GDELIEPLLAILHGEVVVEAHPVRVEDQPGGAEAQWAGRHRPDAAPPRFAKEQPAGLDGEEVEAVDEDIDAGQEGGNVALRDPFGKDLQVDFGIDGLGLPCQDFGLALAHGVDGHAVLTVEVGQLEAVGVGNVKGADPQPCEGCQVNAADAAQAGNGDPL